MSKKILVISGSPRKGGNLENLQDVASPNINVIYGAGAWLLGDIQGNNAVV